MERSYPNELAQRVRSSWPADARPLPATLEAIFATAYHASFLRDEERPVTFRVLVLPLAELPAEGGPPSGLQPVAFETPRAFDEHELARLSPAVEVHRALVGVDEVNGQPVAWGMVQSGPRWLQAAQGGRAKEPAMPRCLVVRVVRPGHLVVGCGSRLVAELHGGKLSDFTLDVFQAQWLRALFAEARATMASEHRAASRNPLAEPVAAALTGYLAQQMLKRILATLRATHHGGLVVIGPPDCAQRYLRTKYVLRDSPSRRRFRTLALAILEVLAERSSATARTADANLYRLDPDPRLAELDEALFETSHLMASLAKVDGAVVLTQRYEILGFGAEIAGDFPPVAEVRKALDLEGDAFGTEVVDTVGTRHRSAYRFCAAVPESVAIVVSQDGGVRFVTNHRGSVTCWDHGPGDD